MHRKKAACSAIRFACQHWQVATQRKTGTAGAFAALRMLLPVLARGLLSAGNAGTPDQGSINTRRQRGKQSRPSRAHNKGESIFISVQSDGAAPPIAL